MTDREQIAELAEQLPGHAMNDPFAVEPGLPEELQKWRIEDKGAAAWAMEKLAGYVGQQNENDSIADERITRLRAEIESVQEWAREENDKLQGSVDYFTEQLRVWHMSIVEADPNDDEAWDKEKNKTVTLPDGVVSVRKGSYSTQIEDEDAFADWLTDQDDEFEAEFLVTRLASDAKSRITQYIGATGEIPPGVKYERSEPKFEVKPKVGG